jgi:hypothetical protein
MAYAIPSFFIRVGFSRSLAGMDRNQIRPLKFSPMENPGQGCTQIFLAITIG